jgi:cell division protein FtsI/penicillin-binding protein 2
MRYQHPEWNDRTGRGTWKRYAGLAFVLILGAAGVILILVLLQGGISIPGAPAPTPASQEPTIYRAPSPETAARAFLDKWKAEDYAGMYALLSATSRSAISEDDFRTFYAELHNESTLTSLEYILLSVDVTPTDATVGFEATLHTVLVGDIVRRTRMRLTNADGEWRVAWDGQTALPELENGNKLVMQRTPTPRGSIYDRDGLALAADAEAVEIGVVPEEITDGETVAAYLASALHLPREMIRQMYAGAPPADYVPIGDANKDDLGSWYSTLNGLGGVYLTTTSMRYYYGGGVASHVVGYMRRISPEMAAEYRARGYAGGESVGAAGLEQSLEADLAGRPGGTLWVTAPSGAFLSKLAESDPRPAMEVYTTLDRDLQAQIERTVFGPYNGAAVVLDRNTGQVLAMASSERFDSNLFNPESVNGAYLVAGILADPDSPLLNRATLGEYPLGSVFKIVTMAAGLESGLFAPGSVYDDATGIYVGADGVERTNWTVEKDIKPQGKLTLTQCLVQSCNPCFWHVGETLFGEDPNLVAEMARAFGLGSATGIPGLDESAGAVPGPGQGEWNVSHALDQAVGQGGLLVTPLQVADFVAAIGNGGTLYRPQVLLSIQSSEGGKAFAFAPVARGELPIQAANLQAIQEAMRGVIYDPNGTARSRFGGKTGTAQSGGEEPHSWFVAYTFSAKPNKPDIAVAVIAEYSGEGSTYAARMVRRVFEIYFFGKPSALYPWESEYGMRGTETPTETEEIVPEEETPPAAAP